LKEDASKRSGKPALPMGRLEAAASISHAVNPPKAMIGSMAVAVTRPSDAGLTGQEAWHGISPLGTGLHWVSALSKNGAERSFP
jgi:hypothetical protein